MIIELVAILKSFLQSGIGCGLTLKKAYRSRGDGRTKGRSHSFVLDFLVHLHQGKRT
jgi:hypothetical protein